MKKVLFIAVVVVLLASCAKSTHIYEVGPMTPVPVVVELKSDKQAQRIQKRYYRNDVLVPMRAGSSLELYKEHIEFQKTFLWIHYGLIPERCVSQIEEQIK